MAHGLATIDKKPAMFYTGELPWHGLGIALDGPATSAQAIKAASLDWEVAKMPLSYKHRSRYREVPDVFATVRLNPRNKPSSTILGTVGRDYRVLQNVDAFGWFDSIVGEGAAIYHTAGALGKGERVWVLAKLPGTIRVVGDDVVDKYLLLSNSHDGSSTVQVKFTPIRVVCQNTLTMALQDGLGIRVYHRASMQRDLQKAVVTLGIISHGFDEIEKRFKQMQRVQMSGSRLDDYTAEIFPDAEDEENMTAMKRIRSHRANVAELFESGLGNRMSGVAGTLWAAYNGVTEYVDHWMPAKAGKSQHMEATCFGSGYSIKARAYHTAVRLSEIWRN